MSNFINFTNHPSSKWSKEQTEAALALADKIIDVPFPDIDPMATKEEVIRLASVRLGEVLQMDPAVVLCQGEMTFVHNFVDLSRFENLEVVAACSSREASEVSLPDGSTKTVRTFKFRQFRAY